MAPAKRKRRSVGRIVAESPSRSAPRARRARGAERCGPCFDGARVASAKDVSRRHFTHAFKARDKPPFASQTPPRFGELAEAECWSRKGRFTGADVHRGRLISASRQKATLFIDEVGEIALPIQAEGAPGAAIGRCASVGGRGRARSTCASSPRRIAISGRRSKPVASAKTSFYRLNVSDARAECARRVEDIEPLVVASCALLRSATAWTSMSA